MPRRLTVDPDLEAKTRTWTRCVIRKHMALAGLSYRDLAKRLVGAGWNENEKSIANKVAKGEMAASLFLLCLREMGCSTLHLEAWAEEDLPVEGVTIDEVLQDEPITVLDRNEEDHIYRFQIGELRQPVTVKLEADAGGRGYRYTLSHEIPNFGTFVRAAEFGITPAQALRFAIGDLRLPYEWAVLNGNLPDESWLVPKKSHPRAKFATKAR